MRLAEIPASCVRLAVEIYLRHAYPAASRWRAPSLDLSGGESASDLLPRFEDESEESGGRRISRYVLRLGNSRYPHMKLVLEESILQNEYAFSVDTHDQMDIRPEDFPDYEAWMRDRCERSVRRKGAVPLPRPRHRPGPRCGAVCSRAA